MFNSFRKSYFLIVLFPPLFLLFAVVGDSPPPLPGFKSLHNVSMASLYTIVFSTLGPTWNSLLRTRFFVGCETNDLVGGEPSTITRSKIEASLFALEVIISGGHVS